MDILVLDTSFRVISIFESFESFLWTERFCGVGDFEIYTPMTPDLVKILNQDNYLCMNDSIYVMIIEDIEITTVPEQGQYMLVTGRSLESILDRRIVWSQTILNGNLQTEIRRLLVENIILPENNERALNNFIFEMSTDPNITKLTVDSQITRTNLYESLYNMCYMNNIGFSISLSDNNEFVFKLHAGIDRTYDQLINPYVVFSPHFDNIADSNYLESKSKLKTVTIVAGEGEGIDRKTTIVGGGTGLNRRELYTDARDLTQKVDQATMTDEAYRLLLEQRGVEHLSEFIIKKAFDGVADTKTMYTYGKDFFMGDIVQIESEFGVSSKSRVTELIRTQNLEGINIYPTLQMIDVTKFETGGILIPSPIDPGPLGPTTYVHRQNTNSSTWIILHDLDRYPSVVIVDLVGNLVIGDILYNDSNNITISFTSEIAGKAFLN